MTRHEDPSNTSSPRMVNLCLRVEEDLVDWLKDEAKSQDRTLSAEVRRRFRRERDGEKAAA